MALVINTNVASLNAQRNLASTGGALNTALRRLSSGLRVTSAKDDAAGLAISDRMTSQIRGLNQAIRNANDGISLSQTAEGALQETTNMLQRMRELAIQAANGTNSDDDVGFLQAEVDQLISEIGRVATDTTFNGTVLFNGSGGGTFQVGAEAGQAISFTISAADVSTLLGGTQLDISIATSISTLDNAINQVDAIRADLGAVQNRFEYTISNLQSVVENVSAARSRILDADFAAETAALTRAQILQQSGIAMLAQANYLPQAALTLLQ
jgi:flagellin